MPEGFLIAKDWDPKIPQRNSFRPPGHEAPPLPLHTSLKKIADAARTGARCFVSESLRVKSARAYDNSRQTLK